jgi:iron complex outermembrane recepter protein
MKAMLLAGASIVATINATPARAEDAPAQAQSSQPAIQEIVVTAQKRSERLQDVPIAIAAVTAGALKETGIRSTQDLSTAVAGLNVTRTTEATVFTLRGVGTQGGSTGQDSTVATFIDGVYMPSMAGATFALNNIDRIEVLKGPQGTLYGRNATGGAVSVITKTPSDTFSSDGQVGYGDHQTFEGNLYVTGPIQQNIRADLAVYYHDQAKGFGYDQVTGQQVNKGTDFMVRSKILFILGPETKLTLAGDYGRTEGSWAISYRPVPSSQLEDGTGYAQFLAKGNGFWDSQSEFDPKIDTQSYGGSAKLEQGLGDDFSLTDIFAFRGSVGFQRVDVDATSDKIIDAPLYNMEQQWTEELQLNYKHGNLTGVAGFFYMDSTSQYDPFQIDGAAIAGEVAATPLAGLTDRLVIYSQQYTKSYAGFGQLTWEFQPQTNLTVGLRYTSDHRRLHADEYFDVGQADPNASCSQNCEPTGTMIPLATVDQHQTFDKLTWRFALDHKFSSNFMTYASYSRGFKSGVYNLTSPADPAAKPETLDAGELGFKSTVLGRLRFNMAGFYYSYKNIQAFQVNGASTTLTNAASATIYGLDADFSAALGAGFRLDGSTSVIHGRYGDFPIATISYLSRPAGAPTYAGYTPGLGNYVYPGCSSTPGTFYCSASGNHIVNTPDFTLNLALNHEMDLAGGKLKSNFTWAYNDGFYWAVDNRLRQPAYSLFNAQVMWVEPNGHYNLRVWGRNLSNTKYLVSLNENGTGDEGAPAIGRTWGVSFGYHF